MKKVFLLVFMILTVVNSQVFDTSGSISFITKNEYKTFFRIAASPLLKMSWRAAWKREAPGVRSIRIKSSADGKKQRALFYNSGSSRKKPLLIALHSWSEDYKQQFSVPYGIWAVKNDWVFIHPDYRGAFTNSMSTASEFAISDILDALEYAKKNANVDQSRIYITGFSGGGMVTLIMAGRYPHIWAGAAAWVPVYDLVQWYQTTRHAKHNYSTHITNSCGGAPLPGTKAQEECLKRSGSTYLSNARGKGVQVYIVTGAKDRFVPPSHSLEAFNDLADSVDQISKKDMEFIDKNHKLPNHLMGEYSDSLFTDAGIDLLFERKSASVVLKIYDGNHDVIYNAGLYWLSKQRRKDSIW